MHAANRFIRNYLLLFYRLALLGIFQLKMSYLSLRGKRSSLAESLISQTSQFDYLSFGAGMGDLVKQLLRFSQRMLIEWRQDKNQLAALIEQRWQKLEFDPAAEKAMPVTIDATLVFHIYYLDIAVEMIELMESRKIKFANLILTFSNPDLVSVLPGLVTNISGSPPKLFLAKNYLRDIAPFLQAVNEFEVTGNVLKLHTKKSPHLSEATATNWRSSLLSNLLPAAAAANQINQVLQAAAVPAIYAPTEWISGKKQWGRNGKYVFQQCLELSIPYCKYAPFPMGTMFWINQAMLAQLKQVSIPIPTPMHTERGLMNGTWPHAFERLPGQLVLAGGIGYQT